MVVRLTTPRPETAALQRSHQQSSSRPVGEP
jgi:hypothetical protein